MHSPINEIDQIQTSITSAEVNELALARYEGPIELVSGRRSTRDAVVKLRGEKILGFDTESRPTFRKGVSYPPSLVQLAASQTVYLFQFPNGNLPGALLPLLRNPNIVKAGVAIRDDIRKLQSMRHFSPGGFVELSDCCQPLRVNHTGLRNLAAIFLHCRVSKGAQTTNWARRDLTPAQVRYAATDAWISRHLYLRFAELDLVAPPSSQPRKSKVDARRSARHSFQRHGS